MDGIEIRAGQAGFVPHSEHIGTADTSVVAAAEPTRP